MPLQRFRIEVDDVGRGSLVDLATGRQVEGVVAFTVSARVGHPTRIVVEYLSSVEGEVAAFEVEHHGKPAG